MYYYIVLCLAFVSHRNKQQPSKAAAGKWPPSLTIQSTYIIVILMFRCFLLQADKPTEPQFFFSLSILAFTWQGDISKAACSGWINPVPGTVNTHALPIRHTHNLDHHGQASSLFNHNHSLQRLNYWTSVCSHNPFLKGSTRLFWETLCSISPRHSGLQPISAVRPSWAEIHTVSKLGMAGEGRHPTGLWWGCSHVAIFSERGFVQVIFSLF